VERRGTCHWRVTFRHIDSGEQGVGNTPHSKDGEGGKRNPFSRGRKGADCANLEGPGGGSPRKIGRKEKKKRKKKCVS